MSIVTLVSGGLDSTLMAFLAREEGIAQFPLFINYGQRAYQRELASARRAMKRIKLRGPKIAQLSGFGRLIRSGLTDKKMDVMEDAFTPGRNLMFLLVASSYAYTVGADAVAIGLLDERFSIFPDQTSTFLQSAEKMLSLELGKAMRVLAPLSGFSKREVVALAEEKGISSTYSCHAGTSRPCGRCVACREFQFEEA